MTRKINNLLSGMKLCIKAAITLYIYVITTMYMHRLFIYSYILIGMPRGKIAVYFFINHILFFKYNPSRVYNKVLKSIKLSFMKNIGTQLLRPIYTSTREITIIIIMIQNVYIYLYFTNYNEYYGHLRSM